MNLENKKVFITFESSSLGDSIAWIPYVLEFKNKHNCEVVVSTFWNKLFKKSYPEITFTEPGQNVNNFNSNFVNNGSNFVTGNPNVNQNSNMQNGNISGNWQL